MFLFYVYTWSFDSYEPIYITSFDHLKHIMTKLAYVPFLMIPFSVQIFFAGGLLELEPVACDSFNSLKTDSTGCSNMSHNLSSLEHESPIRSNTIAAALHTALNTIMLSVTKRISTGPFQSYCVVITALIEPWSRFSTMIEHEFLIWVIIIWNRISGGL